MSDEKALHLERTIAGLRTANGNLRREIAQFRAQVADLRAHAEALYTDLADLDDIRSGSVHLNSMAAYRAAHPLPKRGQ